jgi:hypothetical protein
MKLKYLDDEAHLRRLVLENEDDAAVLYFKALQCLNFFSDIVRSAEGRLDAFVSHSREMLFGRDWLSYGYNADKENTKTILDHNWKMVSQRQRDASTRVLQMLERTTNEIKSLQSGVSCTNNPLQHDHLQWLAFQCPVHHCSTEVFERSAKRYRAE